MKCNEYPPRSPERSTAHPLKIGEGADGGFLLERLLHLISIVATAGIRRDFPQQSLYFDVKRIDDEVK